MSRTLNLIDILLNTGRQLTAMGRFTEALATLTKLSAFRTLPERAFEELQSLLADVHLQQGRHVQARRHLAAAIAVKPLKAEHHYLMGVALIEDSRADRKRAEAYFARAVQIEPDNAAYWIEFGSYLFTIGKKKKALAALGKAFALAAGDADIVGELAEILRREGHFEEATTKLRQAFFQNRGNQRFRQLWQLHQFHLIREEQRQKRDAGQNAEPVILPFTPTPRQGKFLELGAKTIRIDQPEPLGEPREKTPAPYRRPQKG